MGQKPSKHLMQAYREYIQQFKAAEYARLHQLGDRSIGWNHAQLARLTVPLWRRSLEGQV